MKASKKLLNSYPYLKDMFQETRKEADYDKMVFNHDKGYYEELYTRIDL